MLDHPSTVYSGPERRRSLLAVDQVAERLGVSPPFVTRLIRAGALTASNIGSERRPLYRVAEAAVTAYLISTVV